MNLNDMAGRLESASAQAEKYLAEFGNYPDISRETATDCLRSYIAAKLLLKQEEVSDNIIEMVRINVSNASHIPVEALKGMDRPGACGSAPAVLAKRVLLYVGIQKALGITFPAQEMPQIRMIDELTDMVFTLLQTKI